MKFLLVDGSSLISRAYFGFREPPLERLGGLVYGMLGDAVSAMRATHCVVTVDMPGQTFRHTASPEYKASREKKPRSVRTTDLIAAVRPVLEDHNVRVVGVDGFEGDDCIATLTSRLEGRAQVAILSGDKDMHALVSEHVTVYTFSGLKGAVGMAKYVPWTPQEVRSKYGIEPHQIPHWKALAGEKGDDIAGVPNMGRKRAQDVIVRFGTVAAALAAAQAPGVQGNLARLKGQESAAHLGLLLATLRSDAPIAPLLPSECAVANMRSEKVRRS